MHVLVAVLMDLSKGAKNFPMKGFLNCWVKQSFQGSRLVSTGGLTDLALTSNRISFSPSLKLNSGGASDLIIRQPE
jgi:hypothetical protein